MIDLNKTEEITKNIILKSGQLLVENWDSIIITQIKDNYELQTNLDKKIENFIIKNLKKHYPNHNYYGEESGKTNNNTPYTWYIDPIDGTTNCFNKIPIFAISIALTFNNKPLIGIIYNPVTHELFFAVKNQSAYLIRTNHEHFYNSETIIKLNISNIKNLKTATIHTSFPKPNEKEKPKEMNIISSVAKKSRRIRALGSIALALCYTAMGAYDGCFTTNNHVRPYDLAAGMLILEEAGGKLSNRDGKIFELTDSHLVASNGLIHQKLLQAINSS